MKGLRLGLSLTGGTPLFTPASLNPAVWYDPSDLSTLFQDSAGTTPVTADSDPVGMMKDKSGNGRHLTQSTSTRRPLYHTAGGLSWLQFDGVDDYLTTAATSIAAPFIRWTALDQIAWTSGKVIWDDRQGSGTEAFALAEEGASPGLQMYSSAGGGFGAANSGAAVGSGAVVRELWTPASGSSLTVNDGTPVTSTRNSGADSPGFTLGADSNGASAANVAIYGAVLIGGSTPNSAVDHYLAGKAGISF